MKNKLVFALILISALMLVCLAGCAGEKGTETTAPITSEESVSLYFNPDRTTERTADSDGTYTVRFVKDGGEVVSLKVASKELLEKIDSQEFLGLVMDESKTVTDLIYLCDMPYQRVVWNYYVASVGGKLAITNSEEALNGKEIRFEYEKDVPVMDVSSSASTLGEKVALSKDDCITAIADMDGKVKFVYVTDRATMATTVKYCAHCKKEVDFTVWTKDNKLPITDGHYLLATDVTVVKTSLVNAMEGLCLDLYGKTVRQITDGQRIYNLAQSKMRIMDSVGGGTMIPSSTSTAESNQYKWGMIFEISGTDAELRLYSGTLDASECKAQYGCAINMASGAFYMYGGTIKGGHTYGTGSSAISCGGYFSMYGGEIIGGTNFDEGFKSLNIHGGATIRIAGTMNLYGGTITGGESDFDGGVIRVAGNSISAGTTETQSGSLFLFGGTISGGKCKGNGAGIYLDKDANLTIAGDTKVINNERTNLYIADGANLTISHNEIITGDEGAKFGISMEKPGVFMPANATDEIANCFFSDDQALKIQKGEDGTLSLG